MTDTAASISRPVLADRLVARKAGPPTSPWWLGGVAFTSALAQVQVPMWPVPITGQTLAVMLVGATLGAQARLALSMLTYLVLGVAGLGRSSPRFSGGPLSVLGVPSFGFSLGFVPAALVIGWLSQRDWDKKVGLVRSAVLPRQPHPVRHGPPLHGRRAELPRKHRRVARQRS